MDFVYNDRDRRYIADVGAFTVEAIQDCNAISPWDDCDGMAPILTYSYRTFSDTHGGFDLIAAMSDSFIARHWKALCNLAGIASDDARRLKADRTYFRIADAKRELLETWLEDCAPSHYGASEYMGAIEKLCDLLKWPVYRATSRGYSQGDWADILLVWTPDFAKVIGSNFPRSAKARAAAVADLESQAKTWTAWAWGDVYGYVVRDETGEELDSCWGFYGTDFEESGLAEQAADMIRYYREKRKVSRLNRLKALIRARVPVAARADILKEFPL